MQFLALRESSVISCLAPNRGREVRVMGDRWFEEKLAGCRLGDGRLDSRLRQLVEQMEAGFGESIPLA